ncbi:hypothetical protein GCM10017744_001300 [Streptomyces antimycoticus]|uniref:Uncharacterized protein n=1 Tax=Streptomyces antimycoticus TaxID=68175 RepID=A0A4D4KPX9_9ACTN|nr:hypothetical protein SANT12839_098380 [Streptomyces antimycoticus]
MPRQRHPPQCPSPGREVRPEQHHLPPTLPLAKEISTARTNPEPRTDAEKRPSPYEVLAARNVKLRRANRSLTENLQFAAAQIQRLAVDNACLREALEASSNVTRINRTGRAGR